MNSIEPSKSSRASCRTCGQKIQKLEARLGVVETFTMNGEEITSTKWHHLTCGMEKIPEAVLSAKIVEEVTSRGKSISLTPEVIEKVKEFKAKHNTSGLAIKSISEIREVNKLVNIEAKVVRKLGVKSEIDSEGKTGTCAKLYVEHEDHRSSIYLWEDHSSIIMERDDKIIVLKAKSFRANNDNIQFHADSNSVVLVNPTDDAINSHTENIELYVSSAWKRPSGKPAEFMFAPSGRANCGYCEKSIPMGQLKVVKPSFIEIPSGRTIAGIVSFHMDCILNDEHGIEVVWEAISRLNIDLISESHDTLSEFLKKLPESEPREMLKTIL